MTTPITTTTQLEALPVGSVMRGKGGALIERGTTPVASDACTWLDGSWFLLSETIDLYAPLTVLHVPGQTPECDHAALVRNLAQNTVLSLASAEAVVHAATNWTTPAPTVKPGREEVLAALLTVEAGPSTNALTDAVLAILPGKTVAQVRAEALRDAADALEIMRAARRQGRPSLPTPIAVWIRNRADEEAGK